MMISTGGKWHGIPNERGLIQGLSGGGRVGLGALITYPTNYPGSLDRLYPSIAPATADPAAVISSKNGLAGTGTLGYLAPWPQLPTEYGLIAAALADQQAANLEAGHDTRPTVNVTTGQTLSATPNLTGLGDLTPSNPSYERAVQATVDRIDRMIPNDAAYGPAGVRLYAGIMAYRLGRTAARDSRILAALDRLNTRYEYILKHYPGTTVISSSSPLPRPIGPVQPIVQAYPDGSFAYAPGYGPASQYGAYQVAGRGVPSSPRVSAYTGRVVQGGSLSGLGDTTAQQIESLVMALLPRYPELQFVNAMSANPQRGGYPLFGTEAIAWFTKLYGRAPDQRFNTAAFSAYAGTPDYDADRLLAELKAIQGGYTPPPITLPGYATGVSVPGGPDTGVVITPSGQVTLPAPTTTGPGNTTVSTSVAGLSGTTLAIAGGGLVLLALLMRR